MTGEQRNPLLDTLEHYFGLGDSDAEALLEELESLTLRGGEWLFRQGDLADSLFFLVRGRLQVWIEPDNQNDGQQARMVGEVTPGDSVGEIGLLTGSARTASIRAIRDSQLVKMDRAAFEKFAAKHSNLVIQLAGSIARRLTERTKLGSSAARNLSTVALMPITDAPWLEEFLQGLSAELNRHSPTLLLTSQGLGRLGAPSHALDVQNEISDSLRQWLDEKESVHQLTIYVADGENTAWSRLCLRQSDMVLLLADARCDAEPRQLEKQLLQGTHPSAARQTLLLWHPSPDAMISGTAAWLAPRNVDFHLHLRAGHAQDLGRLARILTGSAVGLVLGGGAARGFAEVGAYRAMCELGINIDWIGGTSIGGIIGALIALDRGPDVVAQITRDSFVKGKPFSDYTFPVLSLIRGKRMERLTQKHLPGEIEDLPMPFFCVSTLLDSGELCLHERGSIWRSMRATAALPGLLAPVVIDHRLAVDGAVVNNLPVDIMRQKPVAKVIAVDVSSRRTYTVDYEDVPSPWAVLRDRLTPGKRKYRVPGLMSVLMKSAELGTASKIRALAADADLLLRPPVDKFGLTDINSFDEIVEAGYADARVHIPRWLSLDEQALPRSDSA